MQVETRSFSLPLSSPLETAAGRIERREGFLVRVTADGHAGVGEATPLPGWTEPHAACADALEVAAERLDDGDPGAVLASMSEAPAARHGLSLALADRAARSAGRPLYRELGGPDRTGWVPVNATLGDGDVEAAKAAAGAATGAGFSCLKVKVGARPIEADVERLAAVRRTAGPDATLRADANGAWDRETARWALDALGDLGVEYVEQPLPAEDLAGLSALRGGPVGIAVDETLVEVAPQRVVEAGAADVLVVKPMVVGGVDRAGEVARMARESGLGTVLTSTVDAAVARTAAVHLCASLPDPAPAGLATADRLAADVGEDPVTVVGGRASVPQAVGHGVRVDGWSS